jgi:hypothetical protein
MSGIDATLSELVFDSTRTQRSRWRVNAGLNDFHPVGMKTAAFFEKNRQLTKSEIKMLKRFQKKDVHKIVVSVKGGKLRADDVRALNHVREREGADS